MWIGPINLPSFILIFRPPRNKLICGLQLPSKSQCSARLCNNGMWLALRSSKYTYIVRSATSQSSSYPIVPKGLSEFRFRSNEFRNIPKVEMQRIEPAPSWLIDTLITRVMRWSFLSYISNNLKSKLDTVAVYDSCLCCQLLDVWVESDRPTFRWQCQDIDSKSWENILRKFQLMLHVRILLHYRFYIYTA